ncbi:hypothetical protein Sde_1310 [Saccharophagus degradans 2-40]|uniref:Uncharacterized protein n=2 Tax=Saccharophagus degradans TaxID=86304 RepID=Q21L57_SACD2|nr:hypothetical protein Sde_1310 [Saccharophagus degradans 2-40]
MAILVLSSHKESRKMRKLIKDSQQANNDVLTMSNAPSSNKFIFVDRRKGDDRRLDADPCSSMPLDLYHRKRRKSREDRRDGSRTLSDDYYAYMQKVMASIKENDASRNS